MAITTYEHQFRSDANRAGIADPLIETIHEQCGIAFAAHPAVDAEYQTPAGCWLVNFRIEPGDATRYDVAMGQCPHRAEGAGQFLVSLTEGVNRSYWFRADADELPHWTYLADKLGIKSTTAAYAVTAYVRCVLAAATGTTYLTPDDER